MSSIEYTNLSISELVKQLEHDMKFGEIILIERLPPVREYERYRDVLMNILKEFHIALVLIRIIFKNGMKRNYAILIQGEGELNKLPEKGEVQGFIIECTENKCVKKVYQSMKFTSSQELISNIQKFAELYHESEVRIIQLKMPEAYSEHIQLF